MAIYNASLLISASNATYFTNVTGGIAAVAVRDFNDTWISSSALLTGSNTFVGNQKLDGKLTISGSDSNQIFFERQGGGDILRLGVSQNGNTFELGLTGSVNKTMWLIDNQGGTRINTFDAPIIATNYLIVQGALTASLQQGYAWVGNSSNVSTLVATSSFGTSIDTGSFATTGSNTFNGDQSITGSLSVFLPKSSGKEFRVNWGNASSASMFTEESAGPNQTLNLNSASLYINRGGLFFSSGSFTSQVGDMQFNAFPSASFTIRTQYGGNAILRANTDYTNPSSNHAYFQASSNGQINIVANGDGIAITGSLGARMQGLLYPLTDGTAGQVITTDGNKNLTFTTITGSGGGTIDTGSFLTTGSINTSQNVLGAINFYPTGSTSGYAINIFNTGSDALYGGTGSMRLGVTDPGNPFIQLKGQPWFQFGTSNQLQFQSFTSSYDNGIIIGPYYTSSEKVHLMPRSSSLQFSQDIGSGEIPIFTLGTHNGVSQSIFEKDLRVKGQFTASLQQGYAWVGDSSGVSTLVATSSFGSGGGGDTGSLLVTASFDNTTRDITFTKGDNTTFKLGGFATTGSNTFYGNQNISGSSGGANFNINAAGASNGTVSIGQTGAGNYQIQQSGSTIIRASSIGSIDNFWTSSFYNDINVANGRITLTGNPSPGTAASYLLGYSGSLVLGNSVNAPTYTALAHITSSQPNGNNGLIFKTNNNTGATLLNGSANIFTNPNTPTTDYIRYIGGSNNLFLNNQNGVNVQITSSAASVSGNRPTMHNNIFNGASNFNINLPAVNPGSHNYNNNIFNAGPVTINGMAFTGSLTLGSNINALGTITINAASASFVDIASGLSGSHTINVNSNGLFGGVITLTTNRNQPSNINQNITNNVLAGGSINITNHSSSLAVSVQSNISNGTMTYNNVGARDLGVLHRSAGSMNSNYGSMNLIASASAITSLGNTSPASLAVINRSYSGSLGSGSLSYNNNAVFGASNTYTVSGSYGGTVQGASMNSNGIFGLGNTFFTNVEGRGNYVGFSSNIVGGSNLILTGSNNTILSEQGGAHFGRWNANDGIRNSTGETIFSVGTGVSGSRKTGFLIDSGSNSFFEGSLNVSGSTSMTGSLLVTSFTTLASVSSSLDFADDTAAAAGGVPLGGLYRNGNFVMIRLT